MSDATEKPGSEEKVPEAAKPAAPDPDKILKLLEAEMQMSRERRLAAEKKQRSSVSLVAILIGFLFFLVAASFFAEGIRDAMKLKEAGKPVPSGVQEPKPEGAPLPAPSSSRDSR